MRLGLTPWDFDDRSAAALSQQASRAEALGYESFWLPENHFNPGAIPDPLMLLAAVAAATKRIQLATTSYLLPLRNPLQAAEQVAVLDQLSGGRVLLGVGLQVLQQATGVNAIFYFAPTIFEDARIGDPLFCASATG